MTRELLAAFVANLPALYAALGAFIHARQANRRLRNSSTRPYGTDYQVSRPPNGPGNRDRGTP